MSQITGDMVVYASITTVMNQDKATNYLIEFLNSLSANGLSAHQILLKLGVPIMLLCNLTPPKLCNGTRLKILSLKMNVFEADIFTGCGAYTTHSQQLFIPISGHSVSRQRFLCNDCKQIARTDAESRRRRSYDSLFITRAAICRLLSSQFS